MTKPARNREGIEIHESVDFDGMRRAGRLAAETLDMITPHVVPGAVTDDLDRMIHLFTTKAGAIPATLGYPQGGDNPFPKSCCISINDVVCHGIPAKDKKLKNGDIVNIDVTCILDGWYGDTSRTYLVGDVKPPARKLVDVTYDCMMRGIEAVRPGAHLGDIGHAIQSLAESHGYSVVRDFCGHGLGRVFHQAPSVLHIGRKGEGPVVEPGMFFTIEPMINLGHFATRVLADGWTAITKDRSLSAQFEHTLAVTEDGFEIFTLSPAGYTKPPYV
jgi:methionyl aminopeptidase